MFSFREVQLVLCFVCLKHYLKTIKLPGQCNSVNTLAFSDVSFSYSFCLLFCTIPSYTSKSTEDLLNFRIQGLINLYFQKAPQVILMCTGVISIGPLTQRVNPVLN